MAKPKTSKSTKKPPAKAKDPRKSKNGKAGAAVRAATRRVTVSRPTSPKTATSLGALARAAGAGFFTQTATFRHDQLRPKDNPRTLFDEAAIHELADSILERGLLQPLIVRATVDGTADIIGGERRWRAIGLLIKNGAWPKEKPIPAMLRDSSGADARADALVENLQRVDLNPMDEARALAALQELDPKTYSAPKLANMIGKTSRFVEQRLMLVRRATPKLQKALEKGEVDATRARALAPLPVAMQDDWLQAIKEGEFATADEITDAIEHERLPVEWALFDLAPHAERIVEPKKGKRFFLGRKDFIALQKKAVAAKVKELAAEWSWAESSPYLARHRFEDKHSADRTKAGCVVEFNEHTGHAKIVTGLVRKTEDRDPRTARSQSPSAAAAEVYNEEANAARRRTEEREQALDTLEVALRARLAENVEGMRRVALLYNLDGFSGGGIDYEVSFRFSAPHGDPFAEGEPLHGWASTLGTLVMMEERSLADRESLWKIVAAFDPSETTRLWAAELAGLFCLVNEGWFSDEVPPVLDPALVGICAMLGVVIPEPLLPKPAKGKKEKKAKGPRDADGKPVDMDALNRQLRANREANEEREALEACGPAVSVEPGQPEGEPAAVAEDPDAGERRSQSIDDDLVESLPAHLKA